MIKINWSVTQQCEQLNTSPHNTIPPSVTVTAGRHTSTHVDDPRTQSQVGNRSFSIAEPRLWNNLPTEIRRRGTTFEHYRRLLQAFLFV